MAAISEKYLKEYAAETAFTTDELLETAEKLETAIQSRLNKHFKRSRLRRGRDYWLSDDGSSVWLAFNKSQLGEEMREADMDFDGAKLVTVARAHLELFQQNGATIEVPGSVARHISDRLFYPIRVSYPEQWQGGKSHAFQEFQELVWRYDMTPAEALDYWATEYMNHTAADWAAKRDVEAEAVRKNVRQSEEKLGDENLGVSHENSVLRAVPVDEVPSGMPHDEEKDVFYTPTEESIEGVEDS